MRSHDALHDGQPEPGPARSRREEWILRALEHLELHAVTRIDDIDAHHRDAVELIFAHLDPAIEASVCERLGLQAAAVSSQVIQRDRHAELLSALAITGASLEKFALEIRGLQKTEIGEIEEPFGKGQKGSSAMPHKRNPIGAEQITGLARLLRGNAVAPVLS